MPEPRQTFSFHGFRFEVLRKRHNRIAALRIRPLAPPETGTKAMDQAREAEGEGRSAIEELGAGWPPELRRALLCPAHGLAYISALHRWAGPARDLMSWNNQGGGPWRSQGRGPAGPGSVGSSADGRS